MEKEVFFTGYCRVLDGSRTVCVLLEDDKLTEVDCHYEACPYSKECTIGKSITEQLIMDNDCICCANN